MSNNDFDSKTERMDGDHVFAFACSAELPCFTKCCRDVAIILTPYDVLRLKNNLRITSEQFLEKYAIIVPRQNRLIPMVALKMNGSNKECPFVAKEGCTVYQDRPWPCRVFPLDMNDDGTFRTTADPSLCKGLKNERKQRISDWLIEQGVPVYDEMNVLFSKITSQLLSQELDIDNPQISKMTFMALYNLDKFKKFIFESTFMDRFDIDTARIEKLKRNDLELLKFAFEWISFGLFGEKTLSIKD